MLGAWLAIVEIPGNLRMKRHTIDGRLPFEEAKREAERWVDSFAGKTRWTLWITRVEFGPYTYDNRRAA